MKNLLLFLFMFFLPIVILAEKVKINGVYYNLNESEKTAEVTYETRSFNEKTYSGELIIPNEITHDNETYTVSSIGEYAFSNCSNLTSVTIPNNVISIGRDAFLNSGWYNNQPEGVIYLSNFMIGYKGEKPIGKLTISDGTTLIADRALINCSELTSISLPNSLKYIGKETFFGCSGITSITIPDNVISIDDWAFRDCSGIISATIPNSVKIMGGAVFYNCSSLISAVVPNGITSIKGYTFWECSSLTSVSIPNSITSIGECAFSGCKSLNSISIPCNVVSIGREAFVHCKKITSIVIPVGVTKIDIGAFMHCSSLNSVNIPVGLTSIDTDAFYECYNLESVNIPNTVNSIGERAFYKCRNITSLTIPEDIQIIKKQTFYGCNALKNVIIPSKVEFVYQEAFANCSSLELIEALPTNPPFLYDNSFSNFSVPLKVPKGCKEAYQTAQGWKNFTNISDGVKYRLKYIVDNVEYKSFEMEEGATITPEPAPTKDGYTFSGWSEIPTTMPAHDVTVTGTFSINKYKLTYKVDGVEYKSYEVAFGASIIPEPAPTKEGYTFSGWSEIPATMPAHDVTITGTFSINKYKLTYMIDDKVYKETMYEYGATITPETQPEGDYASFEWTNLPQTMPAHDVVVYASYTSGITELLMEKLNNIQIYSPNGKRLNALQKGVNIIRMSDGKSKKFVVK